MSVGVLSSGPRVFHWESASKPALQRCAVRNGATLRPAPASPHLHHSRYPCHRHHHHRLRRRHFTCESPLWPRRSREVKLPSVARSWHTDTSSLLNTDSFALSGGASTLSSRGSTLSPDTLFGPSNAFISTRMSSSGATRSSSEGNGGTSTAAAREVKQYLNRTLFPRPSSTLHGYASLYHRLKKLPASHRKARQRGTTAPQPNSDSGSSVIQEDGRVESYDLDSIESKVPSPPRVEIHIYVPTAAANTTHEEDASLPTF